MSLNEIIQSVAYDNIMMIFNTLTSYFHKNPFHYFEDYVMTKESDIRVR
jgi:hypothetical protein